MPRGFLVALLVGCSLFGQSVALGQARGPRRGDENAARFGWLFGLDAGKAEARQSGKPLMVVVRCVP
jgi:hypothetical protein